MRAMLNVAVDAVGNASTVAGEGQEIFLVVWSDGEGKQLRVHCQIQCIDAESRSPKTPKRFVEIPPSMNDAIVINLTQLFSRIGVPLAEVEQLERLQKKFPGYRTTRG
jgi:hypothetical protein